MDLDTPPMVPGHPGQIAYCSRTHLLNLNFEWFNGLIMHQSLNNITQSFVYTCDMYNVFSIYCHAIQYHYAYGWTTSSSNLCISTKSTWNCSQTAILFLWQLYFQNTPNFWFYVGCAVQSVDADYKCIKDNPHRPHALT